MKKDKRLIPQGYYCYFLTKNGRRSCPYWSMRKNKPKQENGYCAYLGKGDWDLNAEERWELIYRKDGKELKSKPQTAYEIGLPMSILWDKVKMCGIKDEELD